MKLMVIVPAYNEARTIGSVLEAVPTAIPGIETIDTLVVDDGSTDDTAAIARDHGAQVISHTKNRGVGTAFNTGRIYALEQGVDLVVTIDGDGQFDAHDITALATPIVEGKAHFVTASRFLPGSTCHDMPGIKRWGNRFMTRLINHLAHVQFTDVSCGFRAYSSEALIRLNLFGEFTYTQETILSLAMHQVEFTEVPIKAAGHRRHGASHISSNLLRYGLQTGKIIVRTFRDYQPLRFFLQLAAFNLLASAGFGVFVTVHYLNTANVSPHIWAALASAFFLMLAIIFVITALAEDASARLRATVEEILVNQRRDQLKQAQGKH